MPSKAITPDLDKAADDAFDSTLKNEAEDSEETKEIANPKSDEEEAPEKETKSDADEADESTQDDGSEESEESEESEQDEESFLGDELPTFEELPKEMKAIYKNWQKKYTQRRQKDREEIRESEQQREQLQAKIEQLEQQAQQRQPQSQNQGQPQGQEPPKGLTPDDLDKWYETKRQNDYLEQQEKQFMELDNRLLEDSPDYDEMMADVVLSRLARKRDQYEQKNNTVYGFDFVGEAKKAIQSYEEKLQKSGSKLIKEKTQKSKEFIEKNRKENPKAKQAKSKTTERMDLDKSIERAFTSSGN